MFAAHRSGVVDWGPCWSWLGFCISESHLTVGRSSWLLALIGASRHCSIRLLSPSLEKVSSQWRRCKGTSGNVQASFQVRLPCYDPNHLTGQSKLHGRDQIRVEGIQCATNASDQPQWGKRNSIVETEFQGRRKKSNKTNLCNVTFNRQTFDFHFGEHLLYLLD